MRPVRTFLWLVCLSLVLVPSSMLSRSAKVGYFKLHIMPKQAYVFIDGVPIWRGNAKYYAQPGEHTLDFYNYGYKHTTQKITLEAGKTQSLDVNMEAIPGSASGPWGRIQIEGPYFDAVLLNGGTPDFFVGHVDEFNNENIWKQELLVPPGTYGVKLLRVGSGVEDYSGNVTVAENQRVVIYVQHNGKQVTHEWTRGKGMSSIPRFKAGIASTTVAVVKPTGQFSAANSQLNCGESTTLTWSTTDAAQVEITNLGQLPASGQKTVQPSDSTKYTMTAAGPGGKVTSDADVNVNKAVTSSLSVSPSEIRYHRVGDKVVEQGSSTVSWSSGNASTVAVDPFGSVGPSGSQTVQPVPKKTDQGPIDETVTYTLTASNACGGSDTKTAILHLTGSIEPAENKAVETELETRLGLNSVYFPTNLPTEKAPQEGLVGSQKSVLTTLATDFKKYLSIRPEAKLILQAHADKRGSAQFNQALSERRANLVKSFLTEQGIPAASIETHAFGSSENMSPDQVKELQESNPNLTPEQRAAMEKNFPIIVLANNRRVDVSLSTTGQQSKRYYPYTAPDSSDLLSPAEKRQLKAAEARKARKAVKAPKGKKK
jgi:outer membrane protein OmpA-like peptidoglycan-associated protein